jgi:hypothetical protein
MNTNRLENRLQSQNGDFPPSWYPEEGEVLVGELLHYTSAKTTHGDVNIAVIREHDTEQAFSVWLSRSVLRAEFEKHSPGPGDTVGIKFHGQKVSRKGTSYFAYSVEVDHVPVA